MKAPLRSAFTLLELLVVMAIIGVLSTFLAPAVNTILRGSVLSQAGDKIVAALSAARQTALTTNHSVEVRFYRFGDPDVPGESKVDPLSGHYRAVQAFEYKDDGRVVPVGKMEKLPTGIIIDSGAILSTLLASKLTDVNPPNTHTWGTASGKQPSIPTAGTLYNCYAFRYLADGSTNLPNAGAGNPSWWGVTLHNMNDGDGKASPPANFATIRIDPINGSLKIYRP